MPASPSAARKGRAREAAVRGLGVPLCAAAIWASASCSPAPRPTEPTLPAGDTQRRPEHVPAPDAGQPARGSDPECSVDGFCVVLGTGAASSPDETAAAGIAGIWGGSATDLWAVGEAGQILRRDRGDFRPLTGALGIRDLGAVWGSSETDIFVVGANGIVSRFDGTAWTDVSVGLEVPLLDVWGTGPDDVFAVGGPRVVAHGDGRGWHTDRVPDFRYSGDEPQSPALRAVWGAGPAEVYAVGDGGWILRYDGRRWRTLRSETTETLRDVWGTGPGDVYVVGDAGTLLRSDRRGFRREGLHATADLAAIWGSGPDDIYVVGSGGTILHFNGRTWRGLASGVEADLSAVFGIEGEVWIAGRGTILHRPRP